MLQLAGLFLSINVFTLVPAAAQPGEDERTSVRSGDWAGGCDNQGRCTMIGWARDDALDHGERPMLVRIDLLHGAAEPTRVSIRPQPETRSMLISRIDVPGPYVLNFTGTDGEALSVEERAMDLPESMASRFFTHLFVGHRVTAVVANAPSQRMRFAEQGFAEVYVGLRSIGAAQLARHRHHRREQRALLRIRAASEMPLEMTGRVRAPPLPFNATCNWLIGVDYSLRRFALGEERELWQLRCAQRHRNPVTLFYIREPGVEMATPLVLPLADRGEMQAGISGVANANFEFDFGVIRGGAYAGPGEDCGEAWTWGWTGRTFVLLEQQAMPRCGGLTQPDWVSVYSRAAIGPDTR